MPVSIEEITEFHPGMDIILVAGLHNAFQEWIILVFSGIIATRGR